MNEPKLIRDWEELSKVVHLEDKYRIEIAEDGGRGWVKPNFEVSDEEYYEHRHYLHTHTFYGKSYEEETKILQKFGFNVRLANWDEEL